LANAKSVLGDFFLARPTAEALVKQKIITDVGDLPGGLHDRAAKQENALTPVHVSTGSLAGKRVLQVSLGFSHTLALDSEGIVHVFGSGANGRLGLGEGVFAEVTEPRALPASAFGGESVSSVDAGENHSAAITRNGNLYLWGTGAWGRLGTGNQDDAGVPRHVTLPNGALAAHVSAGAYHTLVLSNRGELFAFGWNKNGRCGLGRKHPTLLVLNPEPVPFFASLRAEAESSGNKIPQIVSIEAGQGSSFALLDDGRLFVWGSGSFGVLGLSVDGDDESDQWEPKQVTFLFNVKNATVGAAHMLAIDAQQQLWSWGANEKHQLGHEDASSPAPPASSSASSSSAASVVQSPKVSQLGPAQVTRGVSKVSYVAAGKAHSLVVDTAGKLFSFGLGARGVLGLGSESDVSIPTAVTLPGADNEKVIRADASWTHSAAVTDSGKLFLFGSKSNGRIGV
jgi:alpha-tubulin suppressor-like RCC1 family protein